MKYIQNQESHQGKKTFRDEYLNLSKQTATEHDERYIFKDPV